MRWKSSGKGLPRGLAMLYVLTGSDLKASNTFEAPTKVTPQKAEKPSGTGGRTTLELAPRSYTIVPWSS